MNIETLDGKFTWSFGIYFHIETSQGCFQWSDPDYGGDNSITPCDSYENWIKKLDIPFGRDKGRHNVGKYCGHGNITMKEIEKNEIRL